MTSRFRFLIVPLLAAWPAVLTAKSHTAERFDVRVAVLSDSSLRVVETIRFTFHGGRYTYVSRELAKRRLDRIDAIRAEMDGAPANVEIAENSSRVKVTWRFDADAESTHEFLLSYDVEGAVRAAGDFGRLVWNAIPERHDYEIVAGRIDLQYPAADAASEPAAARAVDAVHQDGSSTFSLPPLPKNRGAAVSLDFRPGFLARPPRWQLADEQRDARRQTIASSSALAALIALLLGAFELGRRRASLPPNHPISVPPVGPAEPSPIPPAMVARLAGTASLYGAVGTLFDLARRGVVSIREGDRGLFGSRSYRIDRQPTAEPLLPFEAAVLDLATAANPPTVSSFVSRLTSSGSRIAARVQEHMLTRGFLSRDRIEMRRQWLAATGLLALAGAVLLVVGLLSAANGPTGAVAPFGVVAGLGAAALVLGIAGLIAGSTISTLSREGALAAGHARAFREKLDGIARGRAAAARGDFERWLPTAIALGLGARWIKRFREQGDPLPPWFLAGSDAEAYAFFDFVSATSSSADSAASGGGDGGSGGGSSSAG